MLLAGARVGKDLTFVLAVPLDSLERVALS